MEEMTFFAFVFNIQLFTDFCHNTLSSPSHHRPQYWSSWESLFVDVVHDVVVDVVASVRCEHNRAKHDD
jgi:alpha-galactosidase